MKMPLNQVYLNSMHALGLCFAALGLGIVPRFLCWALRLDSQRVRVFMLKLVTFGLLVKYLISLGSYSGFNQPPMYGDFEAQRHWMEITSNLHHSKWYFYDLQYWGLDYPPLTAYHSLILGKVANWINPDWMALDASRGFESESIKLFMRISSLLTDLVFYSPAVILAVSTDDLTLNCLILPSLILIDHGHFQFNSAMLGLCVFAFSFFARRQILLGTIFFCCALAFKQVALFYALPMFFFVLGHYLSHRLLFFALI